MRHFFSHFYLFALGCFYLSVNAQSITLQECLQLGLEHNLMLQSAKLDLQNHEKKANLLTAGALPDISLRSDLNHSSSNLRQSFSNGIQVEQSGVASIGLAAAADLQWMLFDGLGMFFRFKALKQESQVKALEVSVQINQHTSTISKAFFKARALQVKKKHLDQLIDNQKRQIELATEKWNAGILPRQTMLQLKIEYNKSKIQWIELDTQLKNSLADLAEFIGFTKPFSSVDTLFPENLLPHPEITNASPNWETTLLHQQLKAEEKWLSLNMQSAKSLRYPTLTLNSSFQFSQTENSAGFSLYNRSFGPTLGLGFRLPLLGRNQIQNSIRDTEFSLKINKLNQHSLSRFLNLNHQLAIQQISGLSQQLELAKENTSTALENLQLSTQNFEKGVNSIENLILAQQSWLQSQMQTEDLILKYLEIILEENLRMAGLKIQN
jgi:outer membrane protein